MKKTMLYILASLMFVFTVGGVSVTAAQDAVVGEDVQIEMADGLVIVGTFYATAADSQAPALLLLHQLGGVRGEWESLITALAGKNYNILAVDQRGFGETGGEVDWVVAQEDATALMGWLREQSTVDAEQVTVVGASIGGNVALRICAADPSCHSAIALSPGLDFMGVTTEDAVSSMDGQSIFLAVVQNDPYGSQGAVKTLTAVAPQSVTVTTKIYGGEGTEHATQMVAVYPDLLPSILLWLDSYAR